MSNSSQPHLIELDANTSKPAETINVSAGSAPGPDYLGQETVDVDGHSNDRPGVTSRLPESDENDPRISQMDTGEELPVLVSSDMRTDPCEGTQGSYTEIIEGECNRCGYDRLRHTAQTLAGEHKEVCNACGAIQDGRVDDGYRMPTTDSDRADQWRESGVKLGELLTRDVYDMEPNTGVGPYVYLIDDRSYTNLRKDDIATLFTMVYDDPKTIFEVIIDELGPVDEMILSALGKAHFEEHLEESDDDGYE